MHQENGVKPKKSRHLNSHRPKNVLQTHGYVVGPVIGSGSYALVKVLFIIYLFLEIVYLGRILLLKLNQS